MVVRFPPGARLFPDRTFTVDQYEHLLEEGLLHEDDRVELLDGQVLAMTSKGTPHSSCVTRLNDLLARRLGPRRLLRIQDPVQLDDRSVPEPDLAVVRRRKDCYAKAHPRPRDTLLLIEVADSRADFDRERKGPLYARAGIRELWLVDLEAETVLVCRDPAHGEWGSVERHARGDDLPIAACPEVELTVDEVLG